MVARFEYERRRQMDWHRARAGGRVGRGAGVQSQRIEAGVGVTGHVSFRRRRSVRMREGVRVRVQVQVQVQWLGRALACVFMG